MKNYSIGLDIGTNSVGWAVINEDTYKVLKKGNKKLWGVETFASANQAKDRRLKRSSRRRYNRRKERIKILQEIFSEEINKEDSNFFQKLEESKFENSEKRVPIIDCEKKNIKEYYKKYPTIYHLRKHLVNSAEKEDIRLVYLAIHHIIKYRGNFLYESNFNVNNINFINNLKSLFENCLKYNNYLEISDNIDEINFDIIDKTMLNDSKNDQSINLKKELSKIMSKTIINEFVKLLQGDKFNVNKLFSLDLESEIKLSFKDKSLDELPDELSEYEDLTVFIYNLKDVYDGITLKKLFKNKNITSLSDLMVWKYEKHKEDLVLLKGILKSNQELYDKMFSYDDNSIYRKYVLNKITAEDLKKEIIGCLDAINCKEKIRSEIEKDLIENNFMPRITTVENGIFPYQLNNSELKAIINNQGKYYPFLLEKWQDDKTLLERLLEFRIPYYIGPLNSKSVFSWLVKQKEVKITPFNFNEVVDIPTSAERFITRMIGKCSYLIKEDSLPTNSIYYSEYKVLNELKQIRIGINGKERKLPIELINQIYHELFLKTSGTITDKKLKEYLRTNSNFDMYYNENINITGYSDLNAFANDMKPYIDFFGENGIFNGTNFNIEDAEEIIRYVTTFEDKRILKQKVEEKYNLSNTAIERICNLKYKGWGRLSKKLLLETYGVNKNTGEAHTIMELLEETDMNFQQILFNKDYNFQEIIKEKNNTKQVTKINYDLVKDLVTSPANKRAIYQCLKIIDELVDYIGYNPNNIFLEMAREDGTKKRTDNRKKQLEKIYEKYKDEIDNYEKLSKELKTIDNNEITKKVFLYFIQNGKSLYSPKKLDFDLILSKKDNYQIDHIIPRTLTTDNSLDNLALVLHDENQNKSSNFVLPEEYRTSEMIKWWNHLKKVGLLTTKKYNNLCRTSFSQEAIEGFINRQLVETRQICINVANIIDTYLNKDKKKTKIVYLKAGISSAYRDKYELFKYRGLNDYHHAHDAYLAAVLGLYKNSYFKYPDDFSAIKSINKRLYDVGKFKEAKFGYFLNSLDEEYSKFYNIDKNFDLKEYNTTIIKTLHQNDISVTRKTFVKNDGELFNQNPCPKEEAKVPIKKNMDIKYGGYTSLKPGYFVLVNYKKGNKFIGIPLYYKNAIDKDKYIRSELKLKENETYTIKKDNIPFDTKLCWKNQCFYIKGYSSGLELVNATQISFDSKSYDNYKYLLNYIFNGKVTLSDSEKNKIDKLSDYIFTKALSYYPIYKEKLLKLQEKYKTLSDFNNKCTFIKRVFNMTCTNSPGANFKQFGLVDRMQRLNGQNPKDNCYIIYESPTGIYKTKFNIEGNNEL